MKTMTPRKESHISKKKQGMTIVETIVALVIFATFISGAVRLIMMQRQITDKARMHYTAINIAKNRVELVRNMRTADYQQILAMEEAGSPIDQDGLPDNPLLSKFMRITRIIDDPNNAYRLEIEVEVKIRNPITLTFEGENEHIKSYMAQLL